MPVCYSWHENDVCSILNFINVVSFVLVYTKSNKDIQAKKGQAEIVLKSLVILCARIIMLTGGIMFVYNRTCVFTR